MKAMIAKYLAGVAVAMVSTGVLAWGKDGHQTVGHVAMIELNGSRAKGEVERILDGDGDLAWAAEWPDCAKGSKYCQADPDSEMKAFAHDNPSHHAYHYTAVPFQRVRYAPTGAGTSKHDVVHVLRDSIRFLRGETVENETHQFNERTALFVVAHSVGDIHQPLHIGAGYIGENLKFFNPVTQSQVNVSGTQGGNWLCVGANGLHSKWDTDYVHGIMKIAQVSTSRELAGYLSGQGIIVPDEVPGTDVIDWVGNWATETLQLSKKALSRVRIKEARVQDARGGCAKPGKDARKIAWTVTLPPTYKEDAYSDVPVQVYRAGVRLARVLKAIWPDE